MKANKAIQQVWRWKEEVYHEIKDMSASDRIAYFKGAARRLEERTGEKLGLRRAARRKH